LLDAMSFLAASSRAFGFGGGALAGAGAGASSLADLLLRSSVRGTAAGAVRFTVSVLRVSRQ
jgi:hypothetical protein